MMQLRVLYSAVLFVMCFYGVTNAKTDEPLLHSVVMDQLGQFIMSWTPLEDDIIIEVTVATRGYVSVGFSPSGGMAGADIVLAWVDENEQMQLSDRYGTGNETPLKDPSQDVQLLSGRRNGTHTTVRFLRPWVTCDADHDVTITGDTMRVIYAYDKDTPDPTSLAMPYHDYRGIKPLYLMEPRTAAKIPEPGELYWDVRAPNMLCNDCEILYILHSLRIDAPFYACSTVSAVVISHYMSNTSPSFEE